MVADSSEREATLRFLLSSRDFSFLPKLFSPELLVEKVRETLSGSAKQECGK